jgi:ATP-dependent DNA helicase DinG
MMEVYSYPSPFPVANRPIYVLDGLPIDRKTPAQVDRQWAILIDQIIRSRKNQRGIIHTVSYDRRDKLIKYSHMDKIMLRPESRDTARAVATFKTKAPPVVLTSPSVTTGYDFPGDECRYQVIAKVPFPDANSELSRRRSNVFRDYPFHYAWQQIVQAAGRGVRSETDWCDTFIVDSHFKWLWKDTAKLAPKWFLSALKQCSTIPRRK